MNQQQALVQIDAVMDEIKANSTFRKDIITNFDYPRCVQIEITSKCNSNCIMCPRKGMNRPVMDMEDDLFKKIVDCLIPYPPGLVVLHLAGEPLMLPIDKLVERINYVKDNINNVSVNFFTNGSLLTEEKSRKLIYESKLDNLNFSVDGGNKSEYEAIRVGLDFDVVVNNIKTFVLLNKEAGGKIRTRTNIVPQKANQGSISTYFNLFREIGVDEVGGSGINNIGGFVDARNMKLKEQGPAGFINSPCHRVFQHMNILSNGDVCVCCLDFRGERILGNMKDVNNILDIWLNDQFQDIRIKHLRKQRNQISYCKDCDYLETLNMPEWWPK